VTIRPHLRRIGPPARRQVRLGARVARAAERAGARQYRAGETLCFTTMASRAARIPEAAPGLHHARGCGHRVVVVDHPAGHQAEGWLARFWDRTRGDALCLSCHGIKSRAEFTAWRQAGEAPGILPR
jgi:hypothetical protein